MDGLCIEKGEKEKLLKQIEEFMVDEDKAGPEYFGFGRKLADNIVFKNKANEAGYALEEILFTMAKDEKKHFESLRIIKMIIKGIPECE